MIGSELPVICVCTHGHSDNAGGVAAFDVVYMSESDVGAYPETTDMEERIVKVVVEVSRPQKNSLNWDVMETLASKDTWQNQNGKFERKILI